MIETNFSLLEGEHLLKFLDTKFLSLLSGCVHRRDIKGQRELENDLGSNSDSANMGF